MTVHFMMNMIKVYSNSLLASFPLESSLLDSSGKSILILFASSAPSLP